MVPWQAAGLSFERAQVRYPPETKIFQLINKINTHYSGIDGPLGQQHAAKHTEPAEEQKNALHITITIITNLHKKAKHYLPLTTKSHRQFNTALITTGTTAPLLPTLLP